ncbi:hypothetical protein GR160_09390 [Flavobacterium sp. Sd200]|uniref:TraB/GumN family protein n=1 Tax=Flavobacterium sp. Sd200 TaxID=2692211 RepID=UPI0013697C7E|nr:TraB/GumN family protein [Flavobacterium sp. Sd200]MXN91442.1 hypothetical protein [Flavobacterium sp. Sd200]
MHILKKILLLLLLAGTALTAQEKKYQGLLWEISGNGLKKNSYLYGSMHVSDKVSYHLSDAFYNRLLAADMVANESDPGTWIDLMGVMDGGGYSRSGNFYSRFYLEPATKENLYPLFRSANFTINNLLFRTNETQKEYQEETYLDMFIYRTGRKFKKKTVGLEDTKTSLLNIMNVDYRDMKPQEENIATLQKILKNTGYEEALMNYYRDKDLDMLDSLTTLASPPAYLKALLYDRNTVMVRSIDSLARKGSLFAAVGAAHLPGKNGIIESLRSKGYTVKAVKDSYTDAGKASKERIEAYFTKPVFTKYTTADGVLSLPLYNGSVIENQQNIQSPDLANGGYINVKRLLLKDFLNKNNKLFDHRTLDSLFYENIPGKITSKKQYTQDGYTVYDIKNITKTGNMQHYRYYISPLEIIGISMAGEKNYAQQFESEVFNNIVLKPTVQTWKAYTPKKGGFTVQLPGYSAIYGDNDKAKAVRDVSAYAYNNADKSAYFVLERSLNDSETLEDTDFELKRIHYEFYNQLKIDSTQTKLSVNPSAFISSAKLGNKTIKLKSVIKGAKYYLLGNVGAADADSQKFFDSFTFIPTVDTEEYRAYKDTIAGYSLSIAKAANEILDFEPKRIYDEDYFDDAKTNIFKDTYATRQFMLSSGQQASVFYHHYHRYRSIQSIDSLWAGFKKYITDSDDLEPETDYNAVGTVYADDIAIADYSVATDKASLWDAIINKKNSKITLINEVKQHLDKDDVYTYEGMAISGNNTQAIKFKAYYRRGSSYLVSALVDKSYKNDDPAIEKVFNSFELSEKPKADDLQDDRLQLFIEDAQSEHDSIRYSALASVQHLTLTAKDLPVLKGFMEDFDFTAEETTALTELYIKLSGLKDPAIIPFLEKQYKREDSNTIIQFAVLKALASFKSKGGYKKIKELMDFDLPVPDNSYEVAGLFADFSDDTNNSSLLFPDVMQYYSVPEYHEPVVLFTAHLLVDNAINAKKLKSYKKMLITNTRLEIKRTKSRKANEETGSDNYYDGANDTSKLQNYVELLYAFKKDKEVANLFESIKKLNNKETNLQLALLDIKSGNAGQAEINALLNDPETLFSVYKLLAAKKENELLKDITDEQLSASAIRTITNIDAKKDVITFLDKKTVSHNGNKVSFYFYKIKTTPANVGGYNHASEKLAAIAFVNNGNRINIAAYKNAGLKRITAQDDLEEIKSTIIDAALNAGNSRATFGNGSDNFDAGMFEEDIDY